MALLGALGCAGGGSPPPGGDASSDVDARPDAGPSGIVSLATGSRHTCTVASDGSVVCWGENDEGQLGDGLTDPTMAPVSIGGGAPAASAVGAGGDTSCLVTMSGEVYCWGDNGDGEVAGASSDVWTTPRRIEGVADALSVAVGSGAVGSGHVCARLQGGQVMCWGSNGHGESGRRPSDEPAPPTIVEDVEGVTDVAAGVGFTCAAIDDGSVQCWGENDMGQLGDGTTTDRASPVQATGIDDAMAVAAGDAHACALSAGGSVSCWGDDNYGQLGQGSVGDSSPMPEQVEMLTDVQDVVAGSFYACALTTDGAVSCWGQNIWGQLGNGDREHTGTPVSVPSLSDVIALAAGGWHTCALSSDGEVRCWGLNRDGQSQPDSDDNPVLSPTAVDGIDDARR